MVRHVHLVVLMAALSAGCDRSVKQDLAVAPTPAALECGRRVAIEQGYRPSQYPAEDGTPRLVRLLFGGRGTPTAGPNDPPYEGSPRDWSIHDFLTIRAAGDHLRIEAVGGTVEGKDRAPSPRTLLHVQAIAAQIVAQCG